jgi:hypothetical protein
MAQRIYQIKVKGQLDSSWADWFDGWTITPEEEGTTLLSRQDADQAALHGVLIKIRNLNLPLISVHYIDHEGKEVTEDLTEE